jgi:hypothetical protein
MSALLCQESVGRRGGLDVGGWEVQFSFILSVMFVRDNFFQGPIHLQRQQQLIITWNARLDYVIHFPVRGSLPGEHRHPEDAQRPSPPQRPQKYFISSASAIVQLHTSHLLSLLYSIVAYIRQRS